jgi:CRP-like cAMP-binding protein
MIVKLAERHEEKDGSLTVDMTQQRVSEMVGISRESTNKLLSAWAENGWVRVEHRTLVVLNVKALKALAGQV